ncbi:hypothetical protein FHS91_003812 [Sphingobium xanthum]|uniref:hypothetical protein n=1 Tax=Sphingobium xanthum TaxID=1387165 RepID=UPI001C8BDE93|nr:hypothetical protein [Sphingobium xanthum]
MANYFVSYDLNGSTPTHEQMDKHMATAGWARGRVLETVWYVGTPMNLDAVFDHVNSILSNNDQLLVIDARNASFRNLLITDESLQQAWGQNE